jgi:hypothetical protein
MNFIIEIIFAIIIILFVFVAPILILQNFVKSASKKGTRNAIEEYKKNEEEERKLREELENEK